MIKTRKLYNGKITEYNPADLLQKIKDHYNNNDKKYIELFEVINGNCRVYIDIEYKINGTKEEAKKSKLKYLELVRAKLSKFDYWIIDGARQLDKNTFKISFHIIFTKLYFRNPKNIIKFVDKIDLPHTDKSVYKDFGKEQLMRLPYCSKPVPDNKPNGEPYQPKKAMRLLDDLNQYYDIDKITIGIFEEILITHIIDNAEFVEDFAEKEEEKKEEEPQDNNEEEEETKEIIITGRTAQLTAGKTPTEKYQELSDLVNCLLDEYDTQNFEWEQWKIILWCIKNIGDIEGINFLKLAHDFSKKSLKYDKNETNKVYKVADPNYHGKKLLIGTLIKLAKETNPERYEEWEKIYKPNKVDDKPLNAFDYDDEYYFTDFRNQYFKHIFNNIEEMTTTIMKDIKRVLCLVTQGKGGIITKTTDGFDMVEKFGDNNDFDLKYKTEDNKTNTITLKKFIKSNLIALNKIVCKLDNAEVGNNFNIWSGFKTKKINLEDINEEQKEALKSFLSYIFNILADKDEASYKYILSWIAGIFTKLNGINGIALVFISEQGTGKNTIYEFISEYMLPEWSSFATAGIEAITQKHNKQIQNKRLILVNELCSTREEFKKNFNKIKMYITEPKVSIEPKQVDSLKIDNINNYILFSNNADSIIIEQSDRRYAVFEVSEEKLNDVAYYTELRGKCFNAEFANIFYSYLLEYPAVDIKKIPNTKLRNELKQLSKPSPLKFLDYIEENEIYEDGKAIPAGLFYNEYANWATRQRELVISGTKFGLIMAKKLEKKRTNNCVCYIYKSTGVKQDL